jgi:multicomponent K+:H+ antiporter subunit E
MRQPIQRAARQLPFVLIGGLIVMWLLLNQTLAAGHVVLGAVFAFALAWASLGLRPLHPRIRHAYLVPKLLLVVLMDIVRSNFGVARIVLGLVRDREVRSGFVEIPLDLRDPHGLACLAAILTSTPGTVWVDISPDGGILTVHVLDLKDESEWIEWIKHRYERALMRIFE